MLTDTLTDVARHKEELEPLVLRHGRNILVEHHLPLLFVGDWVSFLKQVPERGLDML